MRTRLCPRCKAHQPVIEVRDQYGSPNLLIFRPHWRGGGLCEDVLVGGQVEDRELILLGIMGSTNERV